MVEVDDGPNEPPLLSGSGGLELDCDGVRDDPLDCVGVVVPAVLDGVDVFAELGALGGGASRAAENAGTRTP
jgi:hypothetical protein